MQPGSRCPPKAPSGVDKRHVDVGFAVHHQAVHRQDFDAAFAATKEVVRRNAVVRHPVQMVGGQRAISTQDHGLLDASLFEKALDRFQNVLARIHAEDVDPAGLIEANSIVSQASVSRFCESSCRSRSVL